MKTKSSYTKKQKIYFRVNGIKIDAHWNSFRTVDEAWKEFEITSHNIHVDLWELVIEEITETKFEVISL